MSKFLVIQLDPKLFLADEVDREAVGALEKYWLELPGIGKALVKADPRGAWVEKVTATLAAQIGLPVAGCELAEKSDGLKMIASPDSGGR